MNKLLQISICLLFTCSLNSQFDVGTIWTYTVQDYPTLKPTEIEIISDTLIDSRRWFKLKGVNGCASNYSNTLIRKDGSKVYMFDNSFDEEKLLYDFDLVAGDEYEIAIPNSSFTYKIKIDSIGTINTSDQNFRIQYIDNIDLGEYIINDIGSSDYLFPQGNICDPHFLNIRCFESIDYEIDFDSEHECDEVIFVLSQEDINTDKLEVFPNPTIDKVNIRLPKLELYKITLHNSKGEMLNVQIQKGKDLGFIKMNELPKGVYYLIIESSSNRILQRVIKL